MIIRRLDWDSDFFNIEIGEIQENKFKTYSKDAKAFKLIYYKSSKIDDFKIDGFKETYTGTKVVYSNYNLKSSTIKNDFVIPVRTIKYDDDLYRLAFQSGHYSRFKKDVNFSKAQFESLYRVWVDNSIKKGYAEDVLVYHENNTIKGFVSYSIISNYEAVIGLIAVDELSRGLGIGKALINEVTRLLQKNNVSTLHIPTQQDNLVACNFYNKMGFKINSKQVIKHFWKL